MRRLEKTEEMAKKSIFRFGGSSSNNAEDDTGITKFKFQELAAATKNFAPESLLGEGENGRTFKGCLKRSGQDVAIRQLDEENISAIYGINEKNEMYLVYEFMPLGSLRNHLHDLNKKPLDWNMRMKIAAGAAKGLKYLHEISNPPAIHGNIKPSNILLCEGSYNPKVSDFFLLKERIPECDESGYTRFFGRQNHRRAPEFLENFKLTQQSDIYSFGLVLLELISGRKAEKTPSLTQWAIRELVVYGEEFTAVADPLLEGCYPEQGLYQALSLAAECLQRKDVTRPRIGYVLNVLSNLASEMYDQNAIQINRAGTLAVGSIDKERLTQQWRGVHCFFV
ncbi:serine/threonine-protein kinase PBL27-like isoform X5 [Papaver somniferum]|uniref:serine/threonine-protein kinase PBL27-like isoform X5 n=1 Tax=Papaver somniferum TaxID=3469 RepID=UPI000E6FC59E|nr:serine/threonine-protein kinase PBL27-like isoform X5 [Papaver somniferum]